MFDAINNNNTNAALIENEKVTTYSELSKLVELRASGLLDGQEDLEEERIAFFLPGSIDYVVTLHAVWRAGGIAVPLNVSSKEQELDHYLRCAQVSRLIAAPDQHDFLAALCTRLGIDLQTPTDVDTTETQTLPNISKDRRALIIFTSGTTNKPKGVVSCHKTIAAQMEAMIRSWEWTSEDSIPLFLPLHHVHGIINVLCCALNVGARVELFAGFNAKRICAQVAADKYNTFMAVPTIYVKLIEYFDGLDDGELTPIVNGFRKMRLNVSGSAACPVKVFNDWQYLTGQTLLERYGMTEIGMGLTNPYRGERRAGYVGQPFHNVEAQLFNEDHEPIDMEDTPGEIRIRGDSIFKEYWDNPKATEESFHDGWFCTGDMAVIEDSYYRIMGRTSIDIIKSGGYKLSALEIEGVLLTHHAIDEVAVLGVPDDTWGEAVVAFIGLKEGQDLVYDELKNWCGDKLSNYKIPKRMEIIDALPRNVMGKVTKSDLKRLL